jgi:hypothetical protein
MSFLTNIVDFFSGSNKTHDQLNAFVNEKFTFFLNNSNLLLTFVSDFEDYKSNTLQPGKSKCNECEDLYILTNDIFEKYFNRINIPYNIDVSEGNSKTNYKNKVLYFFDLKDLKKILNEQNLEKSSSNIAELNKKRLLCKIISLSFIKLYIIVKSIYQTFNIYNSLITNGNANDYYNRDYNSYENYGNSSFQSPYRDEVVPFVEPIRDEIPPFEEPIRDEIPPFEEPIRDELPPIPEPAPIQDEEPPIVEPAPIQDEVPPIPEPAPIPVEPAPIPVEPAPIKDEEPIPVEPAPSTDPLTSVEEPPPLPNTSDTLEGNKLNQANQNGGNIFRTMFDKLTGKKTETPITTNEIAPMFNSSLEPSPEQNLSKEKEKEKEKLQMSSNIFYSIFVILFEDNKDEQLDPTNFNAKFLTKGLTKMTNEVLADKIPKIIQHISNSKIFETDFLGESCLIFRDDNFKFMQLETSDTESKEATLFVDEVDKQHESFNKIIETKRKLLRTTFNKENGETVINYYASQPQQQFANYKFFNAFKSHLKTMITNYFSSRVHLYNNIVKELFVFDKKTGAIISLNSNLTYKYISELSKKTQIILLDLHIALFKTLNSILTDSVNEINVMKKNAPLPLPITPRYEPNIGSQQYLGGTKTRKHNKRNNKKSNKKNIKRSIKKNRKKRQTRKAYKSQL